MDGRRQCGGCSRDSGQSPRGRDEQSRNQGDLVRSARYRPRMGDVAQMPGRFRSTPFPEREGSFTMRLLLIGLSLSLVFGAQPGTRAPAPAGLRCEYLTDPLGIDVEQPRLSWLLPVGSPGQSAYQILVASSSDHLRK